MLPVLIVFFPPVKYNQRELKKKDKALAEAAALLVLKKKYQHLWEDEEK
jgi:hypothetical protein